MINMTKYPNSGGSFLGDHGKRASDKRKIRKLRRELGTMTRLFYACALGDKIPDVLVGKYNRLMGDEGNG